MHVFWLGLPRKEWETVPIRNCQIEIGPTAAAASGRIASGTPSRLFQTTECMDCYNDYWGGYVFLLFQVF